MTNEDEARRFMKWLVGAAALYYTSDTRDLLDRLSRLLAKQSPENFDALVVALLELVNEEEVAIDEARERHGLAPWRLG